MGRHLIDNLARDYVKMLKYGDTLYRCKQLKRAALGRMCTLIKKIKHSFAYLEQVRQHLSRFPAINPTTRTLIVAGFPNVGKSSFVNSITRAKLDTQPYAFTTRSLLLGHLDYKTVRWQVMDTPGVLDHPLEERNVIEMQSVTALAHLEASILFLIDLSHGSNTIAEQVHLLHHLKPLFVSKPLILVLNKADITTFDQLSDEDKSLIINEVRTIDKNPDAQFIPQTLNQVLTSDSSFTSPSTSTSSTSSSSSQDLLTQSKADREAQELPNVLYHGNIIDVVQTSTEPAIGVDIAKALV